MLAVNQYLGAFIIRSGSGECMCKSGNVQSETKRRMERQICLLCVKMGRITINLLNTRALIYLFVKEHKWFDVVGFW